ncbi:uncharacterized protein LOC142626476 [Castanea sativa]|uniref:uncharacterized protein LOC142626476 n=1 Tax=Castanea sativa TaxID=21020 RepID=UPI003F650141
MEEISNMCAGLKLSDKESSEIDIVPPIQNAGFILAGKFYMKRRINMELVARVLKTIWKTEWNFEVCDLGENRALFQFEKRDDLEKIVLLGPWSFDKYMLLLHKMEAGESMTKLSFDKVSFWVQIHGLPMLSQTMDTGKRIGSSLGIIEKVKVDERGFYLGEYMRVRVSIDAIKPLCRGRLVRVGGSSKIWVTFRYERMPIFNYWGGQMNHDEKDCIEGA